MDGEIEKLKSLVQRFSVCWDTWPEFTYVEHVKRQIGFALELAGTHEAGVEHPEPGCPHCQHVYAALRQIAEWILPREQRPSSYNLSPFDQAIGYLPAHHNRPEITLTIRILHQGADLEQPVDECEVRCREEMEKHLAELGAGRGHWPAADNQGGTEGQFSGRVR